MTTLTMMTTCRLLCALLVLALCCCSSACAAGSTGVNKAPVDDNKSAAISLPPAQDNNNSADADGKATGLSPPSSGPSKGLQGNGQPNPLIPGPGDEQGNNVVDGGDVTVPRTQSDQARNTLQKEDSKSTKGTKSDTSLSEEKTGKEAEDSGVIPDTSKETKKVTPTVTAEDVVSAPSPPSSTTKTKPADAKKAEDSAHRTTTTTTRVPTTTTTTTAPEAPSNTTTTEAPTTTTTRVPSRIRRIDGSLSSSAWVCAPLLLAASALAYTAVN
ncbi:putative mucin TcMUCII [Trypanosoma cruzi]|uniref:Mucin TcMUCII, putative n=2 Tax=Trypanosoma cruzi TaxID=5693 RepID=Q4E2B4_TRYCC|nr:mucin TcMUCII, putative [Trypanosoma cruzi]EAN98911.1 mucin TcMUCII, putative [Trypanosoma cruzi]PWV17681.1 putative mucin TcMUCII [Trypanosoma cruzi]|eukprot:XP_820762.1 mucin TcMUCII [Trypanosoma cruzi strain CL Brener]